MPMPTAPLDTSTTSRPALPQPRQALDDLHDPPERQLHAVVRDDVRAQLDDDAVRIGQVFACFGGGHGGYKPANLPSVV